MIFLKLEQLLNADSPRLVTLLEIVTLARPVQPENAALPIVATLFEIVILVKPVQLVNAAVAMLVMPLGIVKLPTFAVGYA